MTDIDLKQARAERDALRSKLAAAVHDDFTTDQQDEIQRLKLMLEQACDIAGRIATDRQDQAVIARLRKASR